MPLLYFCPSNRRYALELVSAYSREFTSRVLAAFDNIESEAHAAEEAYYENKMNEPAWDDSGPDASEIAEAAFDYGLSIYSDLEFVTRQIVGLTIAGLYHLWERLLKDFMIREFRHDHPPYVSPNTVQKADFGKLVKIVSEFGWTIENEQFYSELDRLRLIANVIKHGDGLSCDELLKKAPELFRDFLHPWANAHRSAEDLSLSKDDFSRSVTAVQAFFQEFPERLSRD
jgi:hypothetical protein